VTFDMAVDLDGRHPMQARRRFPPPWTVKKLNEDRFTAQEANGVSVAFIYSPDDLHRQLRDD